MSRPAISAGRLLRDSYAFLAATSGSRLVAGALTPVLALLVTQSFTIDALAVCVIAAAGVRLFLIPVLGPLLDRWNPLVVVFRCEVAATILGLATALAVMKEPVSSGYWLAFFILNAAIQAFEGPAFPRVVLKIVTGKELTKFTAWESAMVSFARFAGPVLAGLFLLVWPTEIALRLVLLTPGLLTLPVYAYVCRRFTTLFTSGEKTAAQGKTLETNIRDWMSGVGSGFRFRWAIKTERYLAIQVFLELVAIVPTFGILLPYLVSHRQWQTSWLGWLEAASGGGLVAGSLLAPRVMTLLGRWQLGVGSTYATAAGVALCAISIRFDSPAALSASLLLANAALGLRMQTGAAQRRLAIPDDFRARVASVHITLNALAAQLGVAAAAGWLTRFSPELWCVLCSGLLFVLALTLPFIPKYRELVLMEVEEARGYYERAFPRAYGHAVPGHTAAG